MQKVASERGALESQGAVLPKERAYDPKDEPFHYPVRFHRSRLDEMYDPIPMSFLKDLMKAIGKYQTKREDESGFRKR